MVAINVKLLSDKKVNKRQRKSSVRSDKTQQVLDGVPDKHMKCRASVKCLRMVVFGHTVIGLVF